MPKTVVPKRTIKRGTGATASSKTAITPKRTLPPPSPPDQEAKKRGRPTNKDRFTKKIKAKKKGPSKKEERKKERDKLLQRVNGVGIDDMFPADMPNRLAEIQAYLGAPTPKIITDVPELWKNPPMMDERFLKAEGPPLSSPLIQAVCYGVERGMSLASICRYLGINYGQLFNWRNQGNRKKTGLKYYLARGIEIARTRFEMTYLDIIQRAAFGLDPMVSIKTKKVMGEIVEENMEFKTGKINPEHAKWLLERRLRTQYAPATVSADMADTMDNDFDDTEEISEEAVVGGVDASVMGFVPAIDVAPVESRAEDQNGE